MKMRRIFCLILAVLLLVSITGCVKTQKAQKDHECQYDVIKLEKDICVWTAYALTAEKIDNVTRFVKSTYHEGEGLFDHPLGYYVNTYEYMQGYRIWFKITNDVVANNYWNKQAGYERYYCYCWDDAKGKEIYVDKSEHVIEITYIGVELVPITEGTPRLEYHNVFNNVKECSICGEIAYQEDPPRVYFVLYYLENDPNFKVK